VEQGEGVTSHGPLITRPFRRLRRWWRHTPSNQAATAIMGAGIVLIVIAGLLYLLVVKVG
jgi:hypothetical protein